MGFASHGTVDFHNFHMAQRWDHSAYCPPVIFPCLWKQKTANELATMRERKKGQQFFVGIYFCGFHGRLLLLLLERLRRRLHMQMMIQIKIITAIRHPTRMATMIKGVSGHSLWYHIKWPVKKRRYFDIWIFRTDGFPKAVPLIGYLGKHIYE